jgi:biotin operon repressor
MVQLPLHDASTGRPLYADELMPVVWTIDALDDPRAATERRSRQIQRLAAEALEQGAVATVTALAEALGVTARTIKRDLQSIRRSGGDVTTRRQLLRAVHASEQPEMGIMSV